MSEKVLFLVLQPLAFLRLPQNEKDYGNPENDEESYNENLDTDIKELVVEKGYSTPQK